MSVTVKIKGSFELGRVSKGYDKALLTGARKMAVNSVNHFKKGFTQGGGQTNDSKNGWKQRQFTRGSGSRNTLISTGTLQKDIKKKEVNTKRVRIGTSSLTKDYAETHNEGEKIRITEKMRKFFWAKYYDTKNKSEKAYWKGLALHKGSFIDIPKREFIGDSAVLTLKNEKTLHKELDKLFML